MATPAGAEHSGMTAERLRALIARRAGAGEPHLAVFARLLLARAEGYVDLLAEEEAFGLLTSAYRFYAAPGPEPRVRAITPTYVTEGWDAGVSVIETSMPDRPFVVDTIREALRAAGVEVRALLHPIYAARRDATGALEALGPPEGTEHRESFVHVAVPTIGDAPALARLGAEVAARLADLRLVTDDFPPLVARAQAIAGELDTLARERPGPIASEATAVAEFLRWLVDGAFVFLGYREYGLEPGHGATVLALRRGTGLGLLRREHDSAFAATRPLDELPEPVRARLSGSRILTVAKTVAVAPVHRRARMDDVAVKEFDADGRVVGERRFLGLFTSKAYAEEASEIPLLRRLLRQVVAAEQVLPGSHDYKELVAVFNALPKAELFASTPADVRATMRTILAAGRDQLVLDVRPQPAAARASVLVVVPRDRFSGEVQEEVRGLLVARLGGTLLDEHVAFVEGERVLLHFAFASGDAPLPGVETLRVEVAAIVRTWAERLSALLVAQHGVVAGGVLAKRWAEAFPEEYRATVSLERAAEEVVLLDAVARTGEMRVTLRNEGEAPTTALRFYLAGEPLVLSECMPMLENLGLRVLAEDQLAVTPAGAARVHVQTFVVQDRQGRRLDVARGEERLGAALHALRGGRVENDPLNRLVLDADLDWRAVDALRTYAGYAAQAGIAARAVAIAALADHPDPARLLFDCFAARFQPGTTADPAACRQRFLQSLDAVPTLRLDLLLRALLDLVEATVRTTFFAPGEREHVAIKLRALDLAHLPRPRPLYEVWVHGPRMDGIHLRSGKIARGGIRHSDRPEDFRTEILGLMKTQSVKNAVIVPTGAKGGFVVKERPEKAAVLAAYQTLIRGLLDLTDNLAGGRVVHPRGLVIHDEEDPYLVVAADKGTATFSDAANAIAAEYGFWLGDAFASGGSHGYDHKALGITARGAWECVRTHFRELGADADTAPLAVVGIGDPSGDVFGNGSLLSRHIRLRAAFNHQHVFLDPDPDPALGWAERERLFRAGLGWDAYDPGLLSPGGAVLSRTAKRVVLSPEAQAMLGLRESTVSGERLVQAVLTLEGDLLFNGGIGTYVAASDESDADVRDPVNDPVRVRAPALRVRVVAEGGNLGFTQRARIEYALAGGRINTDAVDNSAGVDMSDHEVNLKICLQPAVEGGELPFEARNALLGAVTDDVAARVLAHNRSQSRRLGLDQVRSRSRMADFRELIAELERTAGLDRTLEALPDRDALRARRGTFLGFTRPELAVLMAHTKIQLQREIVGSRLPVDPLLEPYLLGYFPPAVVERHRALVARHPLRGPIIATEVANALVDGMGVTFVYRVTRDTGARPVDAVWAWAVAWTLVDGGRLAAELTGGDHAVEAEHHARFVLERTVERATKWLLANVDATRTAAEVVADLADASRQARERLAAWLVGAEAEAFQKLLSELEIAGIPPAPARELATADWIVGALDVVRVAREAGVELDAAGGAYALLEQHLDFAWLWARLVEAGEEDRWHRRAVEGLVADLLDARRRLTRRTLGRGAVPESRLRIVQDLIRDLRATPRVTLAALQVVVREIRRLGEEA